MKKLILVVILFLSAFAIGYAKARVDLRERYFKMGWSLGYGAGLEEVVDHDKKDRFFQRDEDTAWQDFQLRFKDKKPLSWQIEDGDY